MFLDAKELKKTYGIDLICEHCQTIHIGKYDQDYYEDVDPDTVYLRWQCDECEEDNQKSVPKNTPEIDHE